MGMNVLHSLCCSSPLWERYTATKLVPWALEEVDLGASALEIGPGYGANVRALRSRTDKLTAVEISPQLAQRLRGKTTSDTVTVLDGDGAAMPLPDNSFSSVVCFTMLHHVPSPELQDRVFAEAHRVLQPGGVFAGSDGRHSTPFRLMHIGDTYHPVDPDGLAARLAAVGFDDVRIETGATSFRFSAQRR